MSRASVSSQVAKWQVTLARESQWRMQTFAQSGQLSPLASNQCSAVMITDNFNDKVVQLRAKPYACSLGAYVVLQLMAINSFNCILIALF